MPNIVQRFRDKLAKTVVGVSSSDIQQLQSENRFMRSRLGTPPASGVEMMYGAYQYEFNKGLRGDEQWETWDKMQADPMVKSSLRNIELPLQTAEWEFEAASDKPEDLEIKEFCEANLLRKNSDKFGREYWIQTSWKAQRLPEILSMLAMRFAMFAKVMRVVKGKWVYDQLKWLEPSTVDPRGWQLSDDDRLVAVERSYRAPSGRSVFLDPLMPEQIALYPWDFIGARFDGRAMIRSMYGAWFRKDNVQRWGAIWAQKAGAPIPYVVYPHDMPQDHVPRAEEFAKSARGSDPTHGWAAFPTGKDGMREHRQDVREKVQDKRSEHADTLEQRREAVHRKALDGLKARHGDKHLADADWLAKHPDVAKRVADNRAFLKDHPKVAAGLLKNEQFRARHPQLAEQMKDRMQQIRDRRGAAHDKGSDRVTDRREKQLSDHPGLAKNLHKHPQAEKVMAKHPHAAKKAAKHHRKASRASRKK